MAWEALMWRGTCSARTVAVAGKVLAVIQAGTPAPALTAVAAGIPVQVLIQGLASAVPVGTKMPQSRR